MTMKKIVFTLLLLPVLAVPSWAEPNAGAGWRDLWTVPGLSLAYGAVFALAALAMAFGLLSLG